MRTCRPRMGAWIEIGDNIEAQLEAKGRPRMGAWIEMRHQENVP